MPLNQASLPVSRAALEQIEKHLGAVVWFGLDLGLTPDAIDRQHIRDALKLVQEAMKNA